MALPTDDLALPTGNLIVFAPHPDDDAIGCGATLARAAAAGARITVVYVTDGAASHPGSRAFPAGRLRALRETEARVALRELGIGAEPVFVRAPDGRLGELSAARSAELAAGFAGLIARHGAGGVFVPLARDPHPDHVATAALVATALAALGSAAPRAYGYGVWLDIRGAEGDRPAPGEGRTVVVALDAADIERKRRAILAHRSQTGLISDDPDGFTIDAELLERWLVARETFLVGEVPVETSGPIEGTMNRC